MALAPSQWVAREGVPLITCSTCMCLGGVLRKQGHIDFPFVLNAFVNRALPYVIIYSSQKAVRQNPTDHGA